ncbi:MAG: ABC transporter substrate-binding protein [Thermomicrobiales bacterium]
MTTTRRELIFNGGRVALGAAIATGLGASGISLAAAQDKVTIDFPYLWSGPEGEAIQKIVDAFNASQDAIEVKGVSNPDTQRQLAQMTSRNGFDVSDNFDSNIATWADKGALEPLDDFIAADSFDTSDFIERVMTKMQFDGKTWSLPIAVHTTLLLSNTALLEEAGVTAPTTTSELAAAIEKLTKVDGSGNITQLGMNQPNFVAFAYSFGGKWIDADGKPTANDPGNIAALQFWVDNVLSKYGVDQVKRFQSGFGEYASAQAPFYTGKVAMIPDGEWQAQFIKQYAPDLKWSASPIPYVDDKPDLKDTTDLAVSTFFIPANSKHKQEAWTFLKYLVSAEPMRDFTLALANLPARTSLLADPAYAAIPGLDYWLESLKSPNLQAMPNVTWGQEYSTEITSAVDSVLDLSKTPDDALTELQSKAESLAAK